MPESRRQWRRYKCDNLLGKSRSLSNNRGMAARKGWDEVVRKTSPETAVSLIHRFLRSPRPISLYFRPLPQFRSPYTRSAFPLEQRNIHRAVLLSYGSPSFLFLFHSPTCSALPSLVHAPKKNISVVAARKGGRAVERACAHAARACISPYFFMSDVPPRSSSWTIRNPYEKWL